MWFYDKHRFMAKCFVVINAIMLIYDACVMFYFGLRYAEKHQLIEKLEVYNMDSILSSIITVRTRHLVTTRVKVPGIAALSPFFLRDIKQNRPYATSRESHASTRRLVLNCESLYL